MTDFRWMSGGGLLLDSSGDFACTPANTLDSTIDIIRSRLKASVEGWKSYKIGAGLEAVLGTAPAEEAEITVQRKVTQALTNQFLPVGSFQVETLADQDCLHVMVYLNGQLVARTSVSTNGSTT